MKRNRTIARQRGYALAEVLIATAIAAGVFAASASAMSSVVRLSSRTDEVSTIVYEAQIITARVRAGMSDVESLDGFNGWRIETSSPGADHEEVDDRALKIWSLQYHGKNRTQIFEIATPDVAS